MPAASAVPGMSSTPSMRPMSQSWRLGATGAKPTPQLPITTVVTPCQQEGVSSGSHVICPSKCVWMSTKPGVTSSPSASTVSRPSASMRPMAAITPSSMARSARKGGAPVPSTMTPLRMTRSCIPSLPAPLRARQR